MLGVGVSTYEDKQGSRRQRIKHMLGKGQYMEAKRLQLDWNANHPDKRIRVIK